MMKGNLLFVGGDLSGIQKFIYNISSKRAMVSLKGRSAWLKKYTDDVCERILSITEIANSEFSKNEMKIYCSGGKFYLQVPDSDVIRDEIEKVRVCAEKELCEKHKGQLAINVAYFPFYYDGDNVCVDGKVGKIGILWERITQDFNIMKNQKLKHVLLDDYSNFFEVNEVGGDAKVCEVTGIEGASEAKFKFKDENGDKEETLRVLASVKEQIEFGLKLRDKQGFKMLEEYAEGTYLGILRMDVDGLGKRFISGFDSMEEYRSFSNNLDSFFDADNGELNYLYEDYKDYLHIVYAGGDDIFVVGRWDKAIEFAELVRNEFKKYCKEKLRDESLSISGGVAVVGPKFPIAKAAEMAGDAESAAKKYNNSAKNAFNMFGETLSWRDDEFGYVKSYKDQFVSLVTECGLSRSILHKIMRYAAMVKENKAIEAENRRGNNKHKPNMSYIWHTAYYLTRFMSKEKGNKVIYDFCRDLRDNQLYSPEKYRLMSIAARWAELELRINNINK